MPWQSAAAGAAWADMWIQPHTSALHHAASHRRTFTGILCDKSGPKLAALRAGAATPRRKARSPVKENAKAEILCLSAAMGS
jgi:hypothetical protein